MKFSIYLNRRVFVMTVCKTMSLVKVSVCVIGLMCKLQNSASTVVDGPVLLSLMAQTRMTSDSTSIFFTLLKASVALVFRAINESI